MVVINDLSVEKNISSIFFANECDSEAANQTIGWLRNDSLARDAAFRMAKTVALDIDRYWAAAHKGVAGPIDVVDMFSGCGGMSAGFQIVNGVIPAYRLTAAVDIDEIANATYEYNLGLRPVAENISMYKDKALLNRLLGHRREGAPLVLIGCAPCQGFSSHRNQAGEGDPRNSLFLDFARIATQIEPEAILAENVPELLTDRYWPFLEKARSLLEQCGYYVHVAVCNMAEFGLPQERFRALMIAMRRPFAPPHGFLERAAFRTVRESIGFLPPVKAGKRHPKDDMHYSAAHKPSTIETIKAVPKDGGSRPAHVGPACLREAAERNGKAVYEDVYGRLFWDRPAITITAYARNPASGRFVHPEQDRGLTAREAALLQGFPKTYYFAGTLEEKFRQIGNAVPPLFAAFLAIYLLGELTSGATCSDDFDYGITAPIGPSFSRLIPSLKAGHRDLIAHSLYCG
ncbi:MAG: DNA cytosine methyltransferase [Candidatus Methanomethyliaceae archaeon]